MGRMGNFTASDLKRLQNQLNKIQTGNAGAFAESCAKELAARLLAKVIKRTPIGDYSGNSYTCESKQQHKGHKENGKKGGTLRRGWTIEEIKKEGSVYKVDVINNTEYVSYVECGYRTANHKGWVQGHFMLTISEQELQEIASRVLENEIKKYLVECMK